MGVSEVPLAYAQIPVHSCISAARWGVHWDRAGGAGVRVMGLQIIRGGGGNACSFFVSGKGFMEQTIYGYVYVKNDRQSISFCFP